MKVLICKLVHHQPRFVLQLMWYPFIYIVDKPLTKVFGPIDGNGECRWFVEVIATMQNRGIHI